MSTAAASISPSQIADPSENVHGESKTSPYPVVVNDTFAAIGAQRHLGQSKAIVEVNPPELPARVLPEMQHGKVKALPSFNRLSTPAEVADALADEGRRMAPYLRNLAPDLPAQRQRFLLDEFDWRLQTPADAADIGEPISGAGEWAPVRIPHYGPPVGKATAYYRREVSLSRELLDSGRPWIRFEGADYQARVYLNGRCLGQHKGFFATFEFPLGEVARPGSNTLLIELENDGTWQSENGAHEGDKIYAATGPGWDTPGEGWHHCPAGMGLIGPVSIESRPALFIDDAWVRTLPDMESVAVHIEVFNSVAEPERPVIAFAVFGQNFEATAHDWARVPDVEPAGYGSNRYVFSIRLPSARLWSPDAPWLYQLQVRLIQPGGLPSDSLIRQFGVRSFCIDESTTPKGRLLLNKKPVRLRGGNTMGFEQQAVMRGDLEQLRDDFLLARITNFNFLRLTQRPVQREIYDMADRLGIMIQCDLPLFGYLRRPLFVEALRQAGELARHVRAHPSVILISFINEPFPGHWRKVGHRHLDRNELEGFFRAAIEVVHIEHPGIAVKCVDGDYDPPSPGLPDCHVYTLWYHGHAIPWGKLHRGFFSAVKTGWCYACGEYGAEGLDPVDLMRRRYPAKWLPPADDPNAEAKWTPDSISHAQSGRHQALFYDRPSTLEGWVKASQSWQAEAVRLQTQAYRRQDRLVATVIHLFIDAWPAGWMKSIVDFERRPKPAWFACREAFAPWLPMIRSDRSRFYAGELVEMEAWLANDTNDLPVGWRLRYQLESDGSPTLTGEAPARISACAPEFQGFLRWRAPACKCRIRMTLRLALIDECGCIVNDNSEVFEIWPRPDARPLTVALAASDGPAAELVAELGATVDSYAALILADKWPPANAASILKRVEAGATLVLLNLKSGTHEIAGDTIEVKPVGYGPLNFVSRATGHPLVDGFERNDFRHWYSPASDRIEPLLETTFQAPAWTPILLSGEAGWGVTPCSALAAAERPHGHGRIILSQVTLAGRTHANPPAATYARRLLAGL